MIIFFFASSAFSNVFANNYEEIQVLYPWSEDKNELKVAIINTAGLNQDKISVIKNAIESDEYKIEDGKKFFEGWSGALKSDNLITKKFEINVFSAKMTAQDVTIELLNDKMTEYDGYTIPHYNENKITTASIQIFDPNSKSSDQLGNLARHEFGHALGLGHSSDPNSLMYEIIGSHEKLISDCELSALKELKDKKKQTFVECV